MHSCSTPGVDFHITPIGLSPAFAIGERAHERCTGGAGDNHFDEGRASPKTVAATKEETAVVDPERRKKMMVIIGVGGFARCNCRGCWMVCVGQEQSFAEEPALSLAIAHAGSGDGRDTGDHADHNRNRDHNATSTSTPAVTPLTEITPIIIPGAAIAGALAGRHHDYR